MVHFDATERSRRAEDEYFRRKDAEMLHRAREAERVARERAALADALGAPDPDACDQLHACGLRASTTALVEWLPAVEVAWRRRGRTPRPAGALHRGQPSLRRGDGPAGRLADATSRPPDTLFAAGRRALRARLLTLGADDREVVLARVLALCEATGRAAGGYFGVGALSSDQRRHISVIQGDLERPL